MTKQEKRELFVEAWKTVFGVNEVKDDDNFFEVGGDSMKGVQLVACLAEKGLKLDMLKIYTQPTVEEMAEFLEEMSPVDLPDEIFTSPISSADVEKYIQDPSVQKVMETFGIKAEDVVGKTEDKAEKTEKNVQPAQPTASVQPVIGGLPGGQVWGIPYGQGFMIPVQMMLYAVPVACPEGSAPPFPGAVPVSLMPYPMNQTEEKSGRKE